MENIKIEYVDINKLIPNEYNPKQMSEKEADELEKSIKEFGIVDPIIANSAKGREGKIIGGHQRHKIYQSRIGVNNNSIRNNEEKMLCDRTFGNLRRSNY